MARPAISAVGLGKRYRLGATAVRFRTLRDQITTLVKAPFRRVKAVLSGHSTIVSDEHVWALKDVSFDIARGEIVGIIGENGAGKSTLLKVLSRITEPTEGEARLVGRVASLLEVGTGFHPELTGRENVYLNGAILGMRRSEVDARFDDIVGFAEVERFVDTQIKNYSSGMYLRLAFAVAAHLEPEILLVDEVLAVGDAQFQRRCLGKMGDVARSGRTVLLVSHNMEAIQRLCERVIWVHQGRIVEDGDPALVVARYLAHWGSQLEAEYEAPAEALTPDQAAVLRAASLRGADGNPSARLAYGEPFTVEMRWSHRTALPGALYFLRLFDQKERLILASNTGHGDAEIGHQGEIEVQFSLEANILAPGEYYLDLGCFLPPHQRIHKAERCLGFEVLNTSFEGPLPQFNAQAVVAPRSEWRTTTVSAGTEEP